MYAVIESGGKQYRVSEGQAIKLEKLSAEPGEKINFDKVLMIGVGENIHVGAPYLNGGQVTAEVLTHARGKKIRIIKFRRRKHYRRQMGHRQHYTEVKITAIKAANDNARK